MRNACQIDVLVSAKDKLLPADDVAKKLFANFRGCRILSSKISGSRLSVDLLLPEVPGGYQLPMLRSFVDEGLLGRGCALASVHTLREAAAWEILQRAISRRG